MLRGRGLLFHGHEFTWPRISVTWPWITFLGHGSMLHGHGLMLYGYGLFHGHGLMLHGRITVITSVMDYCYMGTAVLTRERDMSKVIV